MAGISETIVREYFELHEFLVRQYRKYVAPALREEDDLDFLVLNPHPRPRTGGLPFVLGSADLAGIERAILVVKAWHTDVFSPTLLSHAPELFRFLEKKSAACQAFANGKPLLKILVLPALPHDAAARDQSIALLRAKGIDAVLSFRTLLADLVSHVEANRNYQKSDLLQILRLLKNYGFLKDPQLELFTKSKRRTLPRA